MSRRHTARARFLERARAVGIPRDEQLRRWAAAARPREPRIAVLPAGVPLTVSNLERFGMTLGGVSGITATIGAAARAAERAAVSFGDVAATFRQPRA